MSTEWDPTEKAGIGKWAGLPGVSGSSLWARWDQDHWDSLNFFMRLNHFKVVNICSI